MLVVIDNSVCEVINSGEHKILSSLENIAECIRSGKHIIFAERATSKAICTNPKLGELGRLAFKNLYHKATEIGQIKNQVDSYILISNEVSSVEKVNLGSKKIFKVPVDYFCENERLLPTNLVAEDLSDCEFYEAMIKKYAKGKGYRYKLNFKYVNGGGLNTHLNYENSIVQGKAPCLAIVDSDKEDEDDSYGDTAMNVMEKYNTLKKYHVTGYYILNVREKENLIPPHLYSIVSDDEDLKRDMDILDKISKHSKLKRICTYGDIKSGVKVAKITKNFSSENMIKEYLKNEITTVVKKNQVDEELLKFISKKLDSICENSPFGEVVNEICDGKNHECDIESVVEYGFSCIDEKKAEKVYLINGVNRLIKKIKENALDISIYKKLEDKKELYSRYKTESLKTEVEKLENKIKVIDKFYEILSFELKDEWDRLSQVCVTWGCSVKLKVVS